MGFSVFIQPYVVFRGKNFKTVFGTLFSTENIILIFVIQRPPLPVHSKMVMHPKNYFLWLFWKILFFFPKTLLYNVLAIYLGFTVCWPTIQRVGLQY